MSFEAAEEVANAVLYEGYLLYPYRANALKNRFRWQFGIVAPRAYAELSQADPWYAQTECLIEPAADPAIDVRVRFLQIEGDAGLERTVDIPNLGIGRLLEAEHLEPIVLRRGEERPIQGLVRASAEPAGPVIKLRLRIENATGVASAESGRDQALRSAFVGTHALIVVRGGRFLSLADAPGKLSAAAASCVNLHTWPVIVGDPDRCDTLLSSPIILYDFPSIAPESRGDLFDATEIDEILALRVLTLTDGEKGEARETDPRAAEIVDRVESTTAGDFDAMPGAWRELLNPEGEPPPEAATTPAGWLSIARGSRVVVRPKRRADAIDLLIEGRTARVEGVYRDVDGHVLVAVVLDDDPAGALHAEFGRFFYYAPEELEPAG
jgi:hypothetical protein